jgi:hypothetical protein
VAGDLDEILGSVRSRRLKEGDYHLIDRMAVSTDQFGEAGSPRLEGSATENCDGDPRGFAAGDAHDTDSAPSGRSGNGDDGVFQGQPETFSRRGAEDAEKKQNQKTMLTQRRKTAKKTTKKNMFRAGADHSASLR